MELKVWPINASPQHLWKLALRGGDSNEVYMIVDVFPRYVSCPMLLCGCGSFFARLATLAFLLIMLVGQTIRPHNIFTHALLGDVYLRGCGSLSALLESRCILYLLT